MREKRWLLLALCGLVLVTLVESAHKSSRPKFKIATTTTTTIAPSTTEDAQDNENDDNETTTVAAETNATTGHTLTGIPQIDYIWDPNLPRELNGYNLSDYPFYNSIPEDIDFKCDGLHDGFYASVPHKCQVYHHCLFGTRYDFLCANFTAFDQKTFICHFVSEVDCANSKKYWHRNDALYKAATTTTTSTSTTTTVAPVTLATGRARDRELPARRRRPPFRRRPAYEYYDDELYYDDEYGRPRGYARDDYEYDERKYRRDRDRDFRERDRDFRDRDSTRSRGDGSDRERDMTVRERFPSRNNRRDPPRARDPPEEESRVRGRDPEQNSRYPGSREVDEPELDDRRVDTKPRESEDRRYSDKRYRDDYDDKDLTASAGATNTNSDGLVKPAAPVTSVYSRPRAPPKIRRPVPLSEQDRFAYKASPSQSTEEPRRRPADAQDDDYYEDELEEVRPTRRPLRRRPSYRDRDRDFYDSRDRDRPYRARYRDDEDEARPRKHPDRSRDRYYDRERDRVSGERGRDRGKDRSPDRSLDRDRGRAQDDRQERPYSSRLLDIDQDRYRPVPRPKEPSRNVDSLKRPSYDRTTERTTSTSTTSTTTTTCLPEHLVRKVEEVREPTERPSSTRAQQHPRIPQEEQERDADIEKTRGSQLDYLDRDQDEGHRGTFVDEYSSEYYDEPEEPATPPPRAPVRIVKRPFLPSRGGNPNPRGLSPVGAKALAFRKEEEKERGHSQDSKEYYDSPGVGHQDDEDARIRMEEKHTYDAYKAVQEGQGKGRSEDYDTSIGRPLMRRPIDRQRDEEVSSHGETDDPQHHEEVSHLKWADDYPGNPNSGTNEQVTTSGTRGKGRIVATENPSYASSYKTEENQENQPTGPGNFRAKQKLNEVTHRLQDIPESEYDVTLNEALTPALNQEPNLPSGFVLPLHRQLGRDTVLQPSENNYKISRPAVSQQQSSQQQKPFVPSPQYVPAAVGTNERVRTVIYRSPESVQISGPQYRQNRGPWQDYTGY